MNKTASYLILLLLPISCCTALKYVPENELLYTGAKVEVVTKTKIKGLGQVKSDVKEVIRPKPNTTVAGMRIPLWLYYKMQQPKKHQKVRNWIKTKLGEQPVYLSSVDASLVSKGIDAKLYNTGFLDSYSESKVVKGKDGKTASFRIKLHLSQPFTVQNISYPQDSLAISGAIQSSQKESLLKKGDRYSLETLTKERVRIDDYLKNRGYYFFNAGYLLFLMDTSYTGNIVNLRLKLKANIPDKATRVYRIGEVNVFPNYKPGADTEAVQKLIIDSVNYYRGIPYIKPKPIITALLFRPNQVYAKHLYQSSLSRLNNLGVFKFVNLDISNPDSLPDSLLLVNLTLTPLPKKAISFEVQAVTKSNDFVGPAAAIALRNRNAFKGAELMIYNIQASLESQYSGQYKGQFSYQIDPHIELDVPRIIGPFHIGGSDMFLPKTKFELEYTYYSRVGYFNMNSFKGDIGYKWKKNLLINHDLTLLNLNYYNIFNTTQSFNELIDTNPLLQRRFENQFIAGIAYSFFYNGQLKPHQKNNFYFNGNAELAGNTLALFSNIISRRPVSSANPSQILGVDFAQYARFDADFRYYHHFDDKTMFAARLMGGWGIPYGNSSALPYAKQFFSGGAYSLRGFQANSVGPGSFVIPESVKNLFYQQQGGEIKLEGNAELRFPIFSVLRGAVFVDAGNTWLNRPNSNAPGGQFQSSLFMQQIALSTGAGLRVDITYFVLRFDVGIPLKNPGLPIGQQWEIKTLTYNNVVFNLAFGYPF